ncbi:MAG: 4Fe-4S binding protein, partial [Geminicoccaceae bacterium]
MRSRAKESSWASFCRALGVFLIAGLLAGLALGRPALGDPALARFLDEVTPAELHASADAFGARLADQPIVPLLEGGEPVGYAFLNSDFATSVGYSGKPIHIMVGVDRDGIITGAKMVKHYEPIVLVGIPEQRIVDVIDGYVGLDVTREVGVEAEGHDVDIVSGATVTVMVIDDSIVRAAIKVARLLGLGGLAPETADQGPRYVLDPEQDAVQDWLSLLGDGTLRRLSLDVGMVNAAFDDGAHPEAAARPAPGPDSDVFIDLYAGLATLPTLGRSVLGEQEYRNLMTRLDDGQHAIVVAGRGRYSFKGSGYVRGGIFDRIQLVQGDISVRFRDRQHKRIGAIAADGAPRMDDVDVFTIPADAGFDPAEPWRLELLVSRDIGPTEKAYLTFDLAYQVPDRYLQPVAQPAQAATDALGPDTPPVGEAGLFAGGHNPLWKTIWQNRQLDIAILVGALAVLTGVFFFQGQLVHFPGVIFWGRIGFLTFTLVWLGWYANAQLSVVNVMTFFNALLSEFSWDYFLMDPLIFIQWAAVAAALLFWGRGAYCGWLCPFGALQELSNRAAKFARVPQITVPWGLHERLWPIKYILFLGLFGLSLYSLDTAERLAEVEPFKTAIILKFMRDWPFVVFALALLVIGLFIERFYCRYLCPLGAALAIPGRVRMFDWLKRYRDCGNPCQTCRNDCPVQAIHPTGEINPNECVNCLHCQVLYQSEAKCPVVIRQAKRRAALLRSQPAAVPQPKE